MKDYSKIKMIGKGGNGHVWRVSDGTQELAKKEIIRYKNKAAYSRFRSEIEIIQNTSHSGIIDIIDYYAPNYKDVKGTPYYLMPIGVPLKDHLEQGVSLDETFRIITTLIETVEFLHSKDITHRDIKIENVLVVNNQVKISDFGLANFPKQKRVSKLNEKIGPAFTIAPEMKRISSKAEYKKADIYSLAKTIWVIITKIWLSFDGQYNSTSSIGLKNHVDLKINQMTHVGTTHYFSLVVLEKLLFDATHNDPEKRPSIEEFKSRFEFWLAGNEDYFLRNGIEWRDAIEQIFPVAVPESCSWNDILSIKQILTIIFETYDNLNHSFFPNSGGMDFTNVEIKKIEGVEYLLLNSCYLLRPTRLLFELMNDFEWSYFRLEMAELTPFLEGESYKGRQIIYLDENSNVSLDEDLSLQNVELFLQGSFLLVQKTAKINNLHGQLDHYSGLHNKMTNNKYKKFLQSIKTAANNGFASGGLTFF